MAIRSWSQAAEAQRLFVHLTFAFQDVPKEHSKGEEAGSGCSGGYPWLFMPAPGLTK